MAALPSVRQKTTDVDNALAPVAQLLSDDNHLLWYTDLDGQQKQLDFQELSAADPWPLPMPIDREGYCTVEFTPRYWATGHSDWLNVCDAIDRYLPQRPVEGEKLRLLDFGCATGRFLRHAHSFAGDRTDVWGCDFAIENINWVKRYLSEDIKIFLNNANPHLPFPDGYFDVITAFSVMTHIDHFEDAWLLELRRITKPGGLLYLTTQNEATWPLLNERPDSLQHLQQANNIPGNLHVCKELFAGEMPAERIVFRMTDDPFYNCNVWVSSDYVRKNWSRFFDIHHIADNSHTSYQSPVIMSPKPHSSPSTVSSITDRPKPR